MTDADLNYIETELNLRLPDAYRALCLDSPFAPSERNWVYWFYNDPDDVVNETRFPLEDGGYRQVNWKPTYLTIGQGAAGDLHLIDTALADSPVYLLSHEDHSIVEEWPSLRAFVEDWKREAEQCEWAEADRARKRSIEAQQTRRLAGILLVLFLLSILILIALIRSPHPTRTHHSKTEVAANEREWTRIAMSAFEAETPDFSRSGQSERIFRQWAEREWHGPDANCSH